MEALGRVEGARAVEKIIMSFRNSVQNLVVNHTLTATNKFGTFKLLIYNEMM
jgi:hypothetical protein